MRPRRCRGFSGPPWTATPWRPGTPSGPASGRPSTWRSRVRCPWARSRTRGVASGEALRVPTGAMLPEGADAVVMVEYTAEHPDQTLEVRRAVAPGENVLKPGEDVGRGAALRGRGKVAPPGHRPVGRSGDPRLTVYQRPRVAILSSGDEIVPMDQRRPRPGAGFQRLSGRGPGAGVGRPASDQRHHYRMISPPPGGPGRGPYRGRPDPHLRRLLGGGAGPDPERHPGPARRRGPGARGGHPARQTHHPGGGGEAEQTPSGPAGAPGLGRGGHGGPGPAAVGAPGRP